VWGTEYTTATATASNFQVISLTSIQNHKQIKTGDKIGANVIDFPISTRTKVRLLGDSAR